MYFHGFMSYNLQVIASPPYFSLCCLVLVLLQYLLYLFLFSPLCWGTYREYTFVKKFLFFYHLCRHLSIHFCPLYDKIQEKKKSKPLLEATDEEVDLTIRSFSFCSCQKDDGCGIKMMLIHLQLTRNLMLKQKAQIRRQTSE